MTETVLVALLALVGTLSGSYMSNRKTTALLDYRMQRLEERVNKHNDVIERTYKLEKQEEIIEEKIRVALTILSSITRGGSDVQRHDTDIHL